MQVALVGVALAVGLALVACGGGDGKANATPPATPHGSFQEVRDALVNRLDSIGTNIGSVPEDVRRSILSDCLELEAYAEAEDVESICGAVEQAMDRDDPGLIDLVVERLRELQPR